jgi:DNA-binding protein HU-beta
MATAVSKQKPLTKSQFISAVAEQAMMSKAEVGTVLDAIGIVVEEQLKPIGPRVVVLPGLIKITNDLIPKRPAQKNWRNPFTGESQDRPAKPAHNKIKVRILKGLKDSAG